MKDSSKPPGKVALVDVKPISIPMISSTTGGGGSPASAASASAHSPVMIAAVAAAVAEAVKGASSGTTTVTIKSISRERIVTSKPGLVSRGTQTGGAEEEGGTEDLQEKRRLIRKQLAVLLHSVLCKVRDELIGNTGEGARACPTAFCGLMKTVLNHLRTCDARQDCPHPHCLSSRQILTHWKTCTQVNCPVCSSLRRVVPAYLDAVVSNPRWRGEIMTRFNWLISFIGPISMRPTNSILRIPPAPQVLQQRSPELEEEDEISHTKNAEE